MSHPQISASNQSHVVFYLYFQIDKHDSLPQRICGACSLFFEMGNDKIKKYKNSLGALWDSAQNEDLRGFYTGLDNVIEVENKKHLFLWNETNPVNNYNFSMKDQEHKICWIPKFS